MNLEEKKSKRIKNKKNTAMLYIAFIAILFYIAYAIYLLVKQPTDIFTIEEEQEGIVTKQYYIVGDRRFCLIHLTNFTGSEGAEEAAQSMADSFVWDSDDE